MPYRAAAASELAQLLSVLSHPCRVRIVEELREGEKNVNALQAVLGISHSGVSQHLALLRSHRLLRERREGRMVFYSLILPRLANWLVDGMEFIEGQAAESLLRRSTLEQARAAWQEGDAKPTSESAANSNHHASEHPSMSSDGVPTPPST